MLPATLKPKDQIRIVSPSGAIDPSYVEGAVNVLTNWGLQVSEGQYARAVVGRFAGTAAQRTADLQESLDDPDIKAILCSRGGYGVSQLIDKLDFSQFERYPKWLIGFSDITILHNAISNLGIASIHGIMAKQLFELPSEAPPLAELRKMLFSEMPHYTIPAEKMNKLGIAKGKLIGGNLSVLMGLRGSRFDLNYKNSILFIEDIAEKPYHIDRMMQNLRFSGTLAELSGLVVGQFSDCEEDVQMKKSIREIILDAVSEFHYPVCFNFPAGHVDYNLPLVMGQNVELRVEPDDVKLIF